MVNRAAPLLVMFGLALSACQQADAASEEMPLAPPAARAAAEGSGLRTAIFAGGCFWGIEAVFSHVNGVKSAVSGYHGGAAASAHYDAVAGGMSRHAEAVRVVYDPAAVRYDQLLQIFFSVGADPTLKNRQGPDVGPHYRTALVPLSKEQGAVAAAYLSQMENSGRWSRPIAARIEAHRKFYPAGKYHQDFLANHPAHRYIVRWDMPKLRALKARHPTLYSATFQRD